MLSKSMPMERATATSPVISRRDPAPFTIPQSYHDSPLMPRRLETAAQCQTMPGNLLKSKSRSLEVFGTVINRKAIGYVSIEVWFSQEDELVFVRLQNVDLTAKPTPAAIGTTWDLELEVKVCLLNQKQRQRVLKPHSAAYIPVKRSLVKEQCLMITCYDAKRQNDLTPIGHVFVRLTDIDLSWKSTLYIREIVPNSKLEGFSTGEIEVKLHWVSAAGTLNVKIGCVRRLKSPRGTLKRPFYIKVFLFIGGCEKKRWKSSAKLAEPNLLFDEGFSADLDSAQITEAIILIQVFAKPKEIFSFHPELIGGVIIGPYMPKLSDTFTHWENMVAKPFEEISEIHDLHL